MFDRFGGSDGSNSHKDICDALGQCCCPSDDYCQAVCDGPALPIAMVSTGTGFVTGLTAGGIAKLAGLSTGVSAAIGTGTGLVCCAVCACVICRCVKNDSDETKNLISKKPETQTMEKGTQQSASENESATENSSILNTVSSWLCCTPRH